MNKIWILIIGIIFGINAIILANVALNPPLQEFGLDEAIGENHVQATITGDDLQHVDVTLEVIGDEPLIVTVPVGTIFEEQSTGLQDMVLIEPSVFHLWSSDSVHHSVSAASASMADHAQDNPSSFAA